MTFEDIVTYIGFIIGLIISVALYLFEYIGFFLVIVITVVCGILMRLAFKGNKKFQASVEKRKEEERRSAESSAILKTGSSASTAKESKGASVVGRAVAGGIIAGGAGAVVGAISAIDKNQREEASKQKNKSWSKKPQSSRNFEAFMI